MLRQLPVDCPGIVIVQHMPEKFTAAFAQRLDLSLIHILVRSVIDGLRGSIEIDSVIGAGCTFRIRLPLTLAIIDGFLISLGEEYFVVPLDMVTECLELDAEQLGDSTYGYLTLRGRRCV